MRKVLYGAEQGGLAKPGEFCFSEEQQYIYVCLPGIRGPDAIKIQRGNPSEPRIWGWDGNEEKPTLTPSILVPGIWHGWMRAGRLESC